MDTDFNFQELYSNLESEQKKLDVRRSNLSGEAIAYCQGVISLFKLKPSDFVWVDAEARTNPEAEAPKRTRRAPAIKYRTPTGIEWTGMGRMKKEFREYLLANGMTEVDKDKFLVDALPPVEHKEKPDLSKLEVIPEADPKKLGDHKKG